MEDAENQWKLNIEAAKKNKFCRELEQLKFQSKSLEREKASQAYAKRGEYRKYYCELEDIELAINEELKSEREKIDQHLSKIKNKVIVFQNQLKDVKPTPEFVEKLRDTMEDIESTITTFKQQQRKMFESLLTEESNIDHEIEIIQARIATLSTAGGGEASSAAKTKTKQAQVSHVANEVKAFEKYLSQYGPQGGWDDYDHGSFLKIRNRLKGKPSFMRIAANNIPGRTYDDIKEHEDWYHMFLQLREAKKKAILEWKHKKEHEQHTVVPDTAEDDKEKERIRREKERKEEMEREERKKELDIWKAQKAEQARLEKEEIDRNEKRKMKLKEQEQKKMIEIREAAREKLRLRKEEQDRLKWRAEAEEEEMRAMRREQAQIEIARFQSRDLRMVEMKQREKQRKEDDEKMKKDRIQRARAAIKVESDRSRLYRPTDAWIQRKKQQDDKSGQVPSMDMPHRAVPSWRQGM